MSVTPLEALASWPEVPENARDSEARPIYIAESVDDASLVQELQRKGWRLVDVRLLAGGEQALRRLEGIATGTISAPRNASELKALELDLRVHKLLSDKNSDASEREEKNAKALKTRSDIDALLTFGRSDVTNVPALLTQSTPLAVLPEKRRGRPKGAKDSKPRPKGQPARGIALQKKLERQDRLDPKVIAVPEE